jgi:hypothetical protein
MEAAADGAYYLGHCRQVPVDASMNVIAGLTSPGVCARRMQVVEMEKSWVFEAASDTMDFK